MKYVDLVVEDTLLVCFPSNPPNNWVCPSTDIIVEKLQRLFKLGFRLTDKITRKNFFTSN